MQRTFKFPLTLSNGEYLFVKALSPSVAHYQHCSAPYRNLAAKFEPESLKDANLYLEIVWLKRYSEVLKHVPRFESYGEQDGRRYMLSQYIEMSLETFIAVKTSDLEESKRWELVESLAPQMLESLYEIHMSGYIHGDVSPKNFRADRDGKVYIIDFQLTKEFVTPSGLHILEEEAKPLG